MKKTAILLIMIILLTFSAYCQPIYKYENTVDISSSISLTNVTEFYADYNMSYSYIKADISDENVDLKLLKSDKGVDVLDTVENMAKTSPNTVAVVNGDFFSRYSGNYGFSLGIEFADNTLNQSPINPDTMATVAYDNNSVFMSYLDFEMKVVSPDGKSEKIRHLNKHTDYYGDILMFTKDFNGGMSPAPGGPVMELVVDNGIVVDMRKNMPSCKIPENGYVLAVSEWVSMFLTKNFKVGDPVKIEYTVTPDLSQVETAFGGGALIVENGLDAGKTGGYSHEVAGFNPRTAIGVDKDGKTLYLVTVDGRQALSKGMKMQQLAELMISLGCHTAVNLDGGGSTVMMASSIYDEELETVNNPTENRKVINAVALTVETDEHEKQPSGIELKPLKEYVFIGEPLIIDYVVYDANKRPISVADSEIVWTCDKGSVVNGVVTSHSGGTVTVTAAYNGFFDTKSFYAVDSISGIDTKPAISLKINEQYKPKISLFDGVGRYIDGISNYSAFEFVSSNPAVASVKEGTITAHSPGKATVTVSKDGINAYIEVCVGDFDYNYYQSFENETFGLVTYPKDVKGNVSLISELALSGKSSAMISYDFRDDASGVSQQSMNILDIFLQLQNNEKDVSKAVYCALDAPVDVSDACDEVSLNIYVKNDFKHTLRVLFSDSDGEIAIAEFDTSNIKKWAWNKVTAKIPDNLKRPLKLTRIYVLYSPGEEKDKGEVYIDDLSFVARKEIAPHETQTNYYIKNKVNTNESYVMRIGALSNGSNPVLSYINKRVEMFVTAYGSGAFLGAGMPKGVAYDNMSAFIRVDASDGGIRNTDSKQWETIYNTVTNTDRKNIVILCEDTIFGSDEFENSVLCDFLAQSSKNVFVITAQQTACYRNIKGVHYFSLDKTPNNAVSGFITKSNSVVEITVGDVVTFDFVQI